MIDSKYYENLSYKFHIKNSYRARALSENGLKSMEDQTALDSKMTNSKS